MSARRPLECEGKSAGSITRAESVNYPSTAKDRHRMSYGRDRCIPVLGLSIRLQGKMLCQIDFEASSDVVND